MGFDNECILNIQSLPGEYFCPVCRTLVYPNEALQSQCTHLYCKPCLAYVVATTHACPYDGYLVTEADSKPLAELNKPLAEAIGKLAVYCLYHRSGCQWQGTLTDCIAHGIACSFGDSPVVCNRCGTQIIHRQVQEHAQTCPGLQPQAQQTEAGLSQTSTTLTPAVAQDLTAASASAITPAATTTVSAAAGAAAAINPASATGAPAPVLAAPASVPAAATIAAASGQSQTQPGAQAPTPEQLYQQQYQQYYQQYPGYDPYQQQYQQYSQYQQQVYPQYAQPQTQVVQQQPLPYGQTQQQIQPHAQPQNQTPLQPQPQQQAPQQLQQYPPVQAVQHHPTPQLPPHLQPQPHLQGQTQATNQAVQMAVQRPPAPAQQPYPQVRPQTLPVGQVQAAGQPFVQPVAQPNQQLHPQMQAQQQLHAPQQVLQPQQHPPQQMQVQQSVPQQQIHLQPQPQPVSQHQVQPHMPLQPYPQSQPQQPQPNLQVQHQYPANAVTGHQSFPQPQMVQQAPPGNLPHRPIHPQQQSGPYQLPQHPGQIQSQFPHQQIPFRPPGEAQQQSMLPPQGSHNLHPMPSQPRAAHQGQQLHQHPGMLPQASQPHHQESGYLHPPQGPPMQQQMHPQGPTPIPQHMHQQQQIHQSHNVVSRPMMTNHAPHQKSQQPFGVPPNLLQPSPNQHHNNLPRSVAASQGTLVSAAGGTKSDIEDKAGRGSELESDLLRKNATASQKDNTGNAVIEHSGPANLNAPDAKSETVVENKEEHDSDSAQIDRGGSEHHTKHERATDSAEKKTEPSNVSKIVLGDGDIQNGDGGRNKPVERIVAESSQGHTDMVADKQVPHGDDAGGFRQSFDRGPVQPSYHERNLSQFAGKERYPQQQIAHGHPSHLPGSSQRFPAPEQLIPQQMAHTGPSDRRFNDPPYQMQSHGQAVGPGAALRPPGLGMPEPLAIHSQPPPLHEQHHPPRPNFPYGSYPPEGANAVFPPPGLPPSNRPPLHGTTARTSHADVLTRPPGPPLGAFDSPIRPMLRGNFAPQDQVGSSRGHGYFDGKQPDPRATQLNMMTANGIPGKDQLNGIHGSTLAHGDSSRHAGYWREFDEDVKQFHGSSHLDGEGGPKYDNYFASRHGDKGMPHFADPLARPFEGGFPGPDGVPPFPSRKIDPFAASSAGGDRHHVDRMNRDRPMGFSEEFPANHEALRRPPEYGSHHIDALPPVGSPGGYSFKNRIRMDDFDPRESLNAKNFIPHPMGPGMVPGNGRSSFGRNYPMSDFAESGHFSAPPFNGEMDPFDSQRRKVASRCLLCKIDCESLEGLEMHSQTMEHQKIAMDIIMDIKRENAKKPRPSKDNLSVKEPSKFRKAGFEKRGNRH